MLFKDAFGWEQPHLERKHDVCRSCDHNIRNTCDANLCDLVTNENDTILECTDYRPFKSYWLSFICFFGFIIALLIEVPEMAWFGVLVRAVALAITAWGAYVMYPSGKGR